MPESITVKVSDSATADVAADQVATINGAAQSPQPYVQRAKIGHGAEGDFNDVSAASPLPTTNSQIGAQADASATSDAGTFSLIALVKRGLGSLTSIAQALAVQLGSGVVTASTQRVTLATDGPEVLNSTAIKNSVAAAATASTIAAAFTSTTSAQALAANANRKGGVIRNDGSAVLYVLFGTGSASAANSTYKLGADGFIDLTGWTGAVQWAFATAPATGGSYAQELT